MIKYKKNIMKRIYFKTDPGGEVGFGKLSDENIKLIKNLYKSEEMKDSPFINDYFNYFQQSAYGVFLSIEDDIDGEIPRYKCIEKISVPKDNQGKYKDGWYLVATALDKSSIEFHLEPNGKFNIDNFLIEFQSFDFEFIKDDIYGDIKFNVTSNFKYNNEILDDYEVVDRGSVDKEVSIFNVKDGCINLFYKNRNYLKETWGENFY